MAEKNKEMTVTAQLRTGRGKNDTRRARAAGLVPLTIYGRGEETVSAVASLAQLAAVLRTSTGRNTIFELAIEGGETSRVMFRDRQINALTNRLMHADLRRLQGDEEITIKVPVVMEGDPVGVKQQGGVLDQVAYEVEVTATPENMPESLTVDVSKLEVEGVVHVSDLTAAEGVTINTGSETVLAALHVVPESVLETDTEPTTETETETPAPEENEEAS